MFCEKIGVFLKNQCNDQIFAITSSSLSKKRQNFRPIFLRKYLKIKTPVPSVHEHSSVEYSPNLATLAAMQLKAASRKAMAAKRGRQPPKQGCQMVYFQTINANFVSFL
jgi:hypothetical protein